VNVVGPNQILTTFKLSPLLHDGDKELRSDIVRSRLGKDDDTGCPWQEVKSAANSNVAAVERMRRAPPVIQILLTRFLECIR